MVLVFLGTLRSEFSKVRPNVIGSFTIKSLEDAYHILREVVPSELESSQRGVSVSFCPCSPRQNNRR